MNDDRQRILKMLKEGKISFEESRKLLDALDRSDESTTPINNEAVARRRTPLVIIFGLIFVFIALSALVFLKLRGGADNALRENMLLNHGFEKGGAQGVSSWSTSASLSLFWADRGAKKAAFAWDDKIFFNGAHSVSITNAGGKEPGILSWRQNISTFPVGTRLMLTGYVKTEAVRGDGASIAIRGLRELKKEIFSASSDTSFNLTGTKDWSMVRVYASVSKETEEIQILCQLDGMGTAWFDELSLVVSK